MTKILTTTLVGLLITSLFVSSSGWAMADNGDKSPIKHVVVIFQENISYDHYFGTYPNALNPPGEPVFTPLPHTPDSNGLTPALLTHNPNLYNPFRLDRTHLILCGTSNEYHGEQIAYDGGLVDKFVQKQGGAEVDGGVSNCSSTANGNESMSYYDGNSVTGLWNYAQHFAMSDSNFATEFGSTLLGHINLISGDTSGVTDGTVVGGQVIANQESMFDDCAKTPAVPIFLTGKNLGDLLNEKGITWGWFAGGFKPTTKWDGIAGHKAVCNATGKRTQSDNGTTKIYGSHYDPFMYYNSTANTHHLRPISNATIGYTDQANHQYDLTDFWNALSVGNMPAVSFLKAPKTQTGHAGDSSVLDEQLFIVNTINKLEQSPQWSSTAVIITYDDSDGLYDHAMPKIVNHSNDPINDFAPTCGGNKIMGDVQDRCGHGPRLPLLVISPYAKSNFISHEVTDQTSVLKFILNNWHLDFDDPISFVNQANSLDNMFDFDNHGSTSIVLLDNKTGEVSSVIPTH
ncbi:MAG: alkaline phosphatase family protein [Thaumarchaeota archaeon]|nr:alkaline phosphatase family protein [Nitrososphaerota archaeon]